MVKSLTPRLSQTRWSVGTDTVRRIDADTDAANLDSLVAIYLQGTFVARPAAGVAGRFYTVTGDGDTKLNGRVYYDNGTTWLVPRFVQDGYAESSAVGTTPLTIKGVASQTADLFTVKNSADTNLFRVTASGAASTQSTVGVTAGVYLGSAASHDATAALVSVAANKPVLVVRAASGQSSSLFLAQDPVGATVANISPAGVASFAGAVTAASASIAGVGTFTSLVASNSITGKNLVSNPFNTNSVSATFGSTAGHLNNIVDIVDAASTKTARILTDGSYATNSRVMIGGSIGNSTTQSVASNIAPLLVTNSYAAAPVGRLVAHGSQTGNLIELVGSDTLIKAKVDNTGNLTVSNTVSSNGTVVGATAITSLFSGYTPNFDINIGTETGAYQHEMIVRHANNDATAVTRQLGLTFKISSESDGTQSNKSAGIAARSTLANSDFPSLVLLAGGAVIASATNNGSDPRFTANRASFLESGGAYNTLTPALSVGAVSGQHIQFTGATMNCYGTNNVVPGTLQIQNGGGNLILGVLGGGSIILPNSVLTFGNDRVYFGTDVFPVTPANNDWHFDGTNNRIRVHNGTSWVTIAS